MMPQVQEMVPSTTRGIAQERRELGGLMGVTGGREQPFPLQEVKVRADIAGDCCRTTVEQRFANPYDVALEAVHTFPLPDEGAVTEMELRAGDVVVRAECREREEAEKTFDRARHEGKRAALLTQERADVHTLRVTNVPPRTEVTVRIVIVERLVQWDGRFCWRFPTVVAPRYTPGVPVGHDGDGTTPDTDQVPDASRLTPPLRLAGGVTLDLEAAICGPLTVLESSLHAVRADFGDRVRVAPSTLATLNKDFILWFACGRQDEFGTRAFTDGQFTLVTVDPPADIEPDAIPRDAVFVIDISGSMDGPKLNAAKRALRAAMRGLNPGDRFRLIAFDTELESLSPDLVEYTQESLTRADQWVLGLQSRGGTEMLPALMEALKGATASGRLRTVLFVTDGQATNDREIFNTVASLRGEARLFPIGIDTAVNSAFLKGLAEVGGGACELLTPHDNIEEAILRVESRVGSPLVSDLYPQGCEPARPEPRVLYAGRPASFLIQGAPESVRLVGKSAAGPRTFTASPVRIDFPLGALWARDRVAWLESRIDLDRREQESLRTEIVRIGVEHGIASRFTAFVAVEMVRSTDGERVTVVQPVELPQDWSEAFLGLQQMACCYDVAAPAPAMLARARSSRCSIRSLHAFKSMDLSLSDVSEHSVPPPTTRADVFADLAGRVIPSQDADGSFGGDVGRTAAAVVVLLLFGNTPKRGAYHRLVAKAVKWLRKRMADARAALAVALVERVESGGALPSRTEVTDLLVCGPEGECLERALLHSGGASV